MAKTKRIYIPFPAQWTVLLASKLHAASKEHNLPYQWSAAEAGGIAMLWQRERQIITSRKNQYTFTLLALNSGDILFFKERGPFGNTEGYKLDEWELDDLVTEIIDVIRKYL